MSDWIDFKELRRHLRFAPVLEHYQVQLKPKGGHQHLGFCPLPNHGGQRRSPSFSANLEKGLFHCFGCGAKGNLLEFAGLMEGVDLEDGHALRQVALKLRDRFCPALAGREPKDTSRPKPPERETPPPVEQRVKVINPPLDFALKELDASHPYLFQRGFTRATVDHFGLGYCGRGLLAGRIAIPLHDQQARLIGYAGRLVDDSAVNEDNPRYRFPGPRERKGVPVEFRKTWFLYNGHRFKEPLGELIVVEGFTAVWWLHQHGFSNVGAPMGADFSERQAELLVKLTRPDARIWLLPDGDKAGERCAGEMLRAISPHRFCRWVRLHEGQQPTDLAAQQLKAHLTQ